MRKSASIDEYIEAGAYYKLYKAIASRCALNIVRLIHGRASDTDKLLAILRRVEEIEVKIGFENYLDHDHPELPTSEFTSFFYGELNDIRNDVCKEINKKAKNIMDELLNIKEVK